MQLWSTVLEAIERSPGLAAWVQAIGTIAGLLIAIAVPRRERHRAARGRAYAVIRSLGPLERALAYALKQDAFGIWAAPT